MCCRLASPRLIIARSFSLLAAPCRLTTFVCCDAEWALVSFGVKRFRTAAIIFENLYIPNYSPAQQATLSLGKDRERQEAERKEKRSTSPEHVQPVKGEISTNVTR